MTSAGKGNQTKPKQRNPPDLLANIWCLHRTEVGFFFQSRGSNWEFLIQILTAKLLTCCMCSNLHFISTFYALFWWWFGSLSNELKTLSRGVQGFTLNVCSLFYYSSYWFVLQWQTSSTENDSWIGNRCWTFCLERGAQSLFWHRTGQCPDERDW